MSARPRRDVPAASRPSARRFARVAATLVAAALLGAGTPAAAAGAAPTAAAPAWAGPGSVTPVSAMPAGAHVVVAAETSSPTPSPAAPTTLALPPATASIDIAPVVDLASPVTPLVAPVAELITRTAGVDGAVARDEAPTEEQYTLSGDVFFEPNSAALTARALDELATIAASLAEEAPSSVAVVGHTDSVDDDAYNQQLSVDRAAAVQRELVARVPGLAVTTEGRGESQPLAVEQGSAAEVDRARALNRRVEITAMR